MSLYNLDWHRENDHPPAVATAKGKNICILCFMDTLTSNSCFKTTKLHVVREFHGMLLTGGETGIYDIAISNAPLLASGMMDVLAAKTVPCLARSLLSLVQTLCEGASQISELFLERVVFLLATSLNPLNLGFEKCGTALHLLAWFFEDKYEAVENHYDTQNMVMLVQKLTILMETNLKDSEADCLLRILGKACLLPCLPRDHGHLPTALLSSVSKLMCDKPKKLQALCIQLLQNGMQSGFLTSVLVRPMATQMKEISRYLQFFSQGLKHCLLAGEEETQAHACELICNLTAIATDASLQKMMVDELCEHLFEILRGVGTGEKSLLKETIEERAVKSLCNLSLGGGLFHHHFTFGRAVIIDVAHDSIQTRNQTLTIAALELLLRGMGSEDLKAQLDFLDAQDLISMLRDLFCEYEPNPCQINFTQSHRQLFCLACELLHKSCSLLELSWEGVWPILLDAFSRGSDLRVATKKYIVESCNTNCSAGACAPCRPWTQIHHDFALQLVQSFLKATGKFCSRGQRIMQELSQGCHQALNKVTQENISQTVSAEECVVHLLEFLLFTSWYDLQACIHADATGVPSFRDEILQFISLIDIHVIPLVLRAVSNGCMAEGISNIFVSLSEIFSGESCQFLCTTKALKGFAYKLLDVQWMCFCLGLLNNCAQSNDINLVSSLWCFILSLVEITVSRFENKAPLNTEALLESRPWISMRELWSLDGILFVIKSGDQGIEDVWEILIRIIRVCYVDSDLDLDSASLSESIAEAVVYRHKRLHESKVLFDAFHIFVKCDLEREADGFLADTHTAKFFLEALSATKIVPLRPGTLPSEWILKRGGCAAQRILYSWVSEAEKSGTNAYQSLAASLASAPRCCLSFFAQCLQDPTTSKQTWDGALRCVREIAMGAPKVPDDLTSHGIGEALKAVIKKSELLDQSHSASMAMECLAVCIAASGAHRIEFLSEIIFILCNKQASWKGNQYLVKGSLSVVNAILYRLILSVRATFFREATRDLRRIIQMLNDHGWFKKASMELMDPTALLEPSDITQINVVSNLQHIYLGMIADSTTGLHSHELGMDAKRVTMDPGILSYFGLYLKEPGRFLSICCLHQHICQQSQNKSWEDITDRPREIITVIQNNLYSESSIARQAALNVFLAILKAEASHPGKKRQPAIEKYLFGCARVLRDMISLLSTSCIPHKNSNPYPNKACSLENIEELSSEHDWSIQMCANCLTAACQTDGFKEWMKESVKIAANEQRLIQNLVVDSQSLFPEVLQMLSKFIELGIIDNQLARVEDAISSDCGTQDLNEMDMQADQTAQGSGWKMDRGVFVVTEMIRSDDNLVRSISMETLRAKIEERQKIIHNYNLQNNTSELNRGIGF